MKRGPTYDQERLYINNNKYMIINEHLLITRLHNIEKKNKCQVEN